jgi:hypothetical protein
LAPGVIKYKENVSVTLRTKDRRKWQIKFGPSVHNGQSAFLANILGNTYATALKETWFVLGYTTN